MTNESQPAERYRISASQLDSFRRCPRAWAWRYIERLPTPPAQSTELGTRVHSIIEGAYLRGEKPDLDEVFRFEGGKAFYPGAIALPMLHQILPTHPGAKIEVPFEETVGNVTYVGRVDLMYVSKGVLHIIDHKTSSDPQKWGKRPADLVDDAQAVVYAGLGMRIAKHAGLQGWASIKQVDFALNYGATDGNPRKALVVHADRRETFQHDFDYLMESLHPVAQHMVELRHTAPSALKLAPLPDACEVYGGCPFKANCNLSVRERITGIMTKNSLISELLAKAKAQPMAPNPEAAPVEVNPPVTAALPEEPETATEPSPKPPTETPQAPPEAEPKKRTRRSPPATAPVPAGYSAVAADVDRVLSEVADIEATLTGPMRAGTYRPNAIQAAAAAGRLSALASFEERDEARQLYTLLVDYIEATAR